MGTPPLSRLTRALTCSSIPELRLSQGQVPGSSVKPIAHIEDAQHAGKALSDVCQATLPKLRTEAFRQGFAYILQEEGITWSCMRDRSGEMTTVTPRDRTAGS